MLPMPDTRRAIVTNTTPLIALAVGLGNLEILRLLHSRVVVPLEVAEELQGAGIEAAGVSAFEQADCWKDLTNQVSLPRILATPWIGARPRSSRHRLT